MMKLIDAIYTAFVVALLFPLALGAWALLIFPGWDVMKPSGGRG